MHSIILFKTSLSLIPCPITPFYSPILPYYLEAIFTFYSLSSPRWTLYTKSQTLIALCDNETLVKPTFFIVVNKSCLQPDLGYTKCPVPNDQKKKKTSCSPSSHRTSDHDQNLFMNTVTIAASTRKPPPAEFFFFTHIHPHTHTHTHIPSSFTLIKGSYCV